VGNGYQVYANQAECEAFMNSIGSTDYCPYSETSNTTNCRFLHAQNAVYLPSVHCIHTAVNSPVCVDSCFPACDGCDTNAHCGVLSASIAGITYGCQCNDGYTGTGKAGHCTKATCSGGSGYQWQCPGQYSYASCGTDGSCSCQQSFEWVANSTDTCQCPADSYLNWNNDQPECITYGHCRQQYQCENVGSAYNAVKCAPYGENSFLPTGVYTCICNPGYEGFEDTPCVCPSGSSEVWSTRFDGFVCLAPGQCTENSQCPYYQTCHGAAPLGTCA